MGNIAIPPCIQASDVSQRIMGLGPWVTAAGLQGYDTTYASIIPACIRDFETDTYLRLSQVQVVQSPDGAYNTGTQLAYAQTTSGGTPTLVTDGAGNNYIVPVVTETNTFYHIDDGFDFMKMTMQSRPVPYVQRMRIMMNSVSIWQMPTIWMSWEYFSGDFWILPVAGPAVTASSAAQFAIMQAGFGNRGYIPQALAYDYQAGFPPGWADPASPNYMPDYAHIRLAAADYVALRVLEDLTEFADAGLAAMSMQGENYSYTRFEKTKQNKRDQYEKFCAKIRGTAGSLRIVAV